MSVESVMLSNHLMTGDGEWALNLLSGGETVHCDILSLLNHYLLNAWRGIQLVGFQIKRTTSRLNYSCFKEVLEFKVIL